MPHNYTPGLKVLEDTRITKIRRLPIRGKVLVATGESVEARKIIAEASLPGPVYTLNAANILGIMPEDLPGAMLINETDPIEPDQAIALSKSFFGLFQTRLNATVRGTLESVSDITGQVIQRSEPRRVSLSAYVDGTVEQILEGEGALISTRGTLIQGIFGLGGECHGEIMVVTDSNESITTEQDIDERVSGKILVCGALITPGALKKAIDRNASGVVAGGFHNEDIRNLLGHEIGVAITGSEKIPTAVILTEGFGQVAMAPRTFDILRNLEGRFASVNGATQIRAGVLRPEIIIVENRHGTQSSGSDDNAFVLQKGSPVRVIRSPFFGRIGKVTALPRELHQLPTEARVRVVEIKFEDGSKAVVPRTNVEMIKTV